MWDKQDEKEFGNMWLIRLQGDKLAKKFTDLKIDGCRQGTMEQKKSH